MYINYEMQVLGKTITLSNGEDDGREIISVEDYDFKHEITEKDIVDYLMPYDKSRLTREFELGFTNACRKLIDEGFIDLDQLESDKYFVEFMQDKYYEEAREAWLKDKLEQEEADNA